jgi:hypothetical protein
MYKPRKMGQLAVSAILAYSTRPRLCGIGAGSATASGTADSLDLTISGFGDFKGKELHCKDARVSISGAGSATVWVDEDLTAEVSGAGSISYYGSPSVTRQISGVGGVNNLGEK